MTPHEKLRKIKQELRLANQTAVVTKVLNEKRDKLDQQLTSMIAELEADMLRIYQQKSKEPQLLTEFNRKKIALNELKKHKQELDDKLDEYDSFSSDIFLELREELISTLLECFPSQKPIYQKLEKFCQESKKTHQILLQLVNIVEKIAQYLDKIIKERAAIKQRGIFSYLWGHNSNLIISASLKEAEKEAKSALSFLSQPAIKEKIEENKLYAEINVVLKDVLLAERKRWGFKSIDPNIHLLNQEIKKQLDSLKKSEEHYQLKLETDFQALQKWIDTMSDIESE
jgi:hypothetical protein